VTEKTEWRSEMRRRLKIITSDKSRLRVEREARLAQALNRIVDARPGLWLSFSPLATEPQFVIQSQKTTLAYPRISSAKDAPSLSFYFSKDGSAPWAVHSSGIREPDTRDARWSVVATGSPGVVRGALIPGLGFDRRLRRLGRGAGFYDRFLKGSQFTKVGVGFSEQVADEIPSEPHDIDLDGLVTDREVIWNMTSSSI